MRDDRARLHDILSAVARIEESTRGDRAAFEADANLQASVLDQLRTISETCRGLSERFCDRFPNPIWSKVVGLRSILLHHAFEIDFEIDPEMVWQIVEQDLPQLRKASEDALTQLSDCSP